MQNNPLVPTTSQKPQTTNPEPPKKCEVPTRSIGILGCADVKATSGSGQGPFPKVHMYVYEKRLRKHIYLYIHPSMHACMHAYMLSYTYFVYV